MYILMYNLWVSLSGPVLGSLVSLELVLDTNSRLNGSKIYNMYSYVFDARVPSKGEKTCFVFIRKSSEKVSKAFESKNMENILLKSGLFYKFTQFGKFTYVSISIRYDLSTITCLKLFF